MADTFSIKENIFSNPISEITSRKIYYLQKSQYPQTPQKWLKLGYGYKFWKTISL